MSSPVHIDPIDTYVSPYSPVHIDPIDTYMSPYFWEHATVEAIINRFELYNVSDLAKLSDDMIDDAKRALDLSYGETVMLKMTLSSTHMTFIYKTRIALSSEA